MMNRSIPSVSKDTNVQSEALPDWGSGWRASHTFPCTILAGAQPEQSNFEGTAWNFIFPIHSYPFLYIIGPLGS